MCHEVHYAIAANNTQNESDLADLKDSWTEYRNLPQYLATLAATQGSDCVTVASAVVSEEFCCYSNWYKVSY